MLKGLEISEVSFSYLHSSNDILRLDSEYFKKQYINEENLIREINYQKLVELGNTILSFGAYSLNNHITYKTEGIPFIRGINLKKGRIDFNNVLYINNEENNLLYKSQVQPETILLSMSGTIGDLAIANKNLNFPLNSNQDIAKIHPSPNIGQYFLYTFLSTHFGQNYLKREARGSVQQHVYLSQIEKIKIPRFSKNFEASVENAVIESNNLYDLSAQLYKQAESILLKEIYLECFKPLAEGINIKTFSQSFALTGRLDAEYYQPKYDQLVEKIKSQTYDSLINIVKIKKSIEPGSKNYREEGLPFMRVADFSKFGLTEPQKYLASEFVTENKDKINKLKPKTGTILFSKDGTVGTAYQLREDFNGITSGAILHLKVRDKAKIIPEYLTLALNSQIVQMQAERDAGGSIILHWRVSEIENVLVPIIDYSKQQLIADLVEKSFALKKQSKHLLETAKRAVEIAIEENEQTALDYINQNTQLDASKYRKYS